MIEETEAKASKSPAKGKSQPTATTIINDESNAGKSAKNTNSSNVMDSTSSNSSDENKENTNISKASRNTTAQSSVAPKKSMATIEPIIEEPDIPGILNSEKLTSCQINLRRNEIVAYGKLSRSMERIQNFVDAVIESKGQAGDGNRLPMLYICGSPGTGKTMSTTKICEAAVAAKIESNEDWEKAPRMCLISCPTLQQFKYREGMQKILDRIGVKQNQLKRSSNDENNAATILILDEIDQLLGKKGAESILTQLCSWAKDENYVLSIIGISNSVFNSKTNRLRDYGMVRFEV